MNRFILSISFFLLGQGLALAQNSLGPVSEPLADLSRIQGNLLGQPNHVQEYGADTSADRVFRYPVSRLSLLRMAKLSDSGHELFVYDTSGRTGFGPVAHMTAYLNDTLRIAVLQPGTSYIVVEQGSASLADTYDFRTQTWCLPTFEHGDTFLYAAEVNSYTRTTFGAGGFQDPADNNFVKSLPLNVGQTNYLHLGTSHGPLWQRIYLDLNDDGDFEDADELLSSSTATLADSVLRIELDPANVGYTSREGRHLRLRILATATPGIGGACGNYRYGSVVDFYVPLQVKHPYPTTGDYDWARIAGDASYDVFSCVRTAPGGGMYVAGNFTPTFPYMTGVTYPSYSHVAYYGMPGGRNQVQTVSAQGSYHWELRNVGSLTRYADDGTLLWTVHMESHSYAGADGSVTIDHIAVDRAGNVYVAGNNRGSNVLVVQPNGDSSFVDNSTNAPVLLKFAPDGRLLFGCRFGYYSTHLSGIDISPNGQLYIGGHFYAQTTFTGTNGVPFSLAPQQDSSDVFLAALSDSGAIRWITTLGGPMWDEASAIAAGPNGVSLAGTFKGTVTFNGLSGSVPITKTAVGSTDAFVAHLTEAGALTGVATWGGVDADYVNDLSLDPRTQDAVAVGSFTGTVTAGSQTLTSAGGQDAIAVRVSPATGVVWASQAGGLGKDQASAVRLDRQGFAWVGLSYDSVQIATFGVPGLSAPEPLNGAFVRLAPLDGRHHTGDPGGLVGRGFGALSLDTSSLTSLNVVGAFGAYDPNIWTGIYTQPDSTRLGRLGKIDGTSSTTAFVARFSGFAPGMITRSEVISPASNGNRLMAYPNPGRKVPSFFTTASGQDVQPFAIYDGAGKQVYSTRVSAEHLSQGFTPTADLAPGIYLARMGTLSTRFVIQK